MNSTPPLWDLSRESWGARSEPLPKLKVGTEADRRQKLKDEMKNIDFFFLWGSKRNYSYYSTMHSGMVPRALSS